MHRISLTLLLLGVVSISSAQTPAVLAPDTIIVAKLTTNLELEKCKVGDPLEAQSSEDAKDGKVLLLKKGSVLLGHITVVEPSAAAQSETMVGVIFDGVKIKNSPNQSVRLLIRAIAPPVTEPESGTISEGRGMPGATTQATVPGKVHAGNPEGSPIGPQSVGVSGFPGIRLEIRKEPNGQSMSIIAFTKTDVKFKKGTQLVLKSAAQ